VKFYSHKYILENEVTVNPMGEIAGFQVRPGMFDINGATALANGVCFTVHTHNGTSCELLLFHREEEEPYAVIPFPEAYKIGDVYSMIVFDLRVEDFEYAYRIDGPYDSGKGLLFDKKTCCWIRMPGWWQVRGFGENTDRRLIMPEFCVMYLTGVTRNSPTRNCVI